jgi:DDE superfamily endonuclease
VLNLHLHVRLVWSTSMSLLACTSTYNSLCYHWKAFKRVFMAPGAVWCRRRREAAKAASAILIAATAVAFVAYSAIQKHFLPRRSSSKRRSRVSLLYIAEYLTDDEFARTFRLPRGAFVNLLATIRPALLRDTGQAARSSGGVVQPALRLAITLRMLAGASYLNLIMLFRVAKPTIYDVFHSTIDVINRRLRMPGIPTSNSARLSFLADGFTRSRTPVSPIYGCIGALDGIAISILKPPDQFVPRNFYCRKGMYALPVQAIVDSSYRFMYVSANCVGSTHDSLSFSCSQLGQMMQDKDVLGSF